MFGSRLPEFRERYDASGHRFLATETTLELAGKMAWLGDIELAKELLDTVGRQDHEPLGALARILQLIARAAVAVGEGEELRATELLRNDELTALGHPESWYWREPWRDRCCCTYFFPRRVRHGHRNHSRARISPGFSLPSFSRQAVRVTSKR